MKKIFRYTTVGLLLAAIIALGAVAGFAQDACADTEGITKMADLFRAQFPDKSIEGRKKAIETGKQFLEKYGACEPAKEMADYLKGQLPKLETTLKALIDAKYKADLLEKFNKALNAKNWDDVYSSGKEILAKYPEDALRPAELVLGSIGLDETAKTPRVTKWNDDTIKYAKMAIADMEAGKAFPTWGVGLFTYKSKDDAIGWMNYTIGYIYFYDKNDKKEGLSYLYKASQANSDTKTNPLVFASIGSYYSEEIKKLIAELTELEAKQDPKAAEDVQKLLLDQIKAKVAMINGTTEAAMDAYARAHENAKEPKYSKAYKDELLKILQGLYNVRFGKMDGFAPYIAATVKKPMPNPTAPVTPISDPEPAKTSSTSTTPATPPATGPASAKPGTPATTVKPVPAPATKPAGPAVKTVGGAKRQAVVKKPAAKRKGA